MNRQEFIEHIKDGLDSGFDRCCIAWYFLRSHMLPALIGHKNFTKLVLWKWDKFGGPRSNHCLCPVCKVKYIKEVPKYYKCTKCGWMQFKNPICNRCT